MAAVVTAARTTATKKVQLAVEIALLAGADPR